LHLVGASRDLAIEDIDLSVIANADFLHLSGTPLMEQLDGEPANRTLSFAKVHEIRTPAFDVPIVDSTGCGDAYNAGFTKAFSLGRD
jgi:sugar/nucleoside kinase (ribokinase family)